MSKRAASTVPPVPSPKIPTAPGTSLRDFLPEEGRDLPGVAEIPGQVSAAHSSSVDDDYDMSVSLPNLLGFPSDFQK